MKFKNYLNEGGLSRVWKHNELHDCGALTAFRKAGECGDGDIYTKKENMARNKSLLSKLKIKGYGVTSLKGVYPEGGNTAKEESFFVVDINDTGSLFSDLKKLGEEFEQDSILLIPKGSIKGENKAYLVGTNHCENNWLKYGKTEVFRKGKLGYSSPIYTSMVNGRPFLFEEYNKVIQNPGSGMGWWSLSITSKKDWKELIE